ncbi:MAG: FAD-binding oxidoreductase [Candidatus Paceibacterota bacterium]
MALEGLKKTFRGEIISEPDRLGLYEQDASIFEVRPSMAVKPKDAEDVRNLVEFVNANKSDNPNLSLTARAGGTDMSGGPLNESIIVDFANFNKVIEVGDGWAITEPGVYYRDFEKATLAKGWLLPSYPASREICAIGGMVANNSAGEKSLSYGKTDNFVEELDVVLSDGQSYELRALKPEELEKKKAQDDFEGKIYRETYELIESNYDAIQAAKPKVSKNSAGYALWNVWDHKIFDLNKLFVGSQGTLGLVTKVKFRLIKPKKVSKLLVVFLNDLKPLADIVNVVMRYEPESFESFDDRTLKLAIRFLPGLVKSMKGNFLTFALRFLPELWLLITGGLPKLLLLVELTGDDESIVQKEIEKLQNELLGLFKVKTRIAKSKADAQKYWTMRRESFNLLRKHVAGKKTAPFIDDIIVKPDKLSEFLPRLEEILAPYKNLIYTLAGHAGNGNFHIIPLMNIDDPSARQTIQELSEKVYNLVIEFGGSITAEHNDGLIRTPYLKKMYGEEIYHLFEKTKQIFDPLNIFNPGKKVGGSLEYALDHIKKN